MAEEKNSFRRRLRILFFILEIALIVALLIIWFASDSFRASKNLWMAFLYCFPAEFLIAIVPHEPVILYFGKFYPPLTVALVTIAGTLLTEALNYSVFKFLTDTALYQKLSQKKAVAKIIKLFNKAPFIALWVAAFTPIPFYPFRFLVVMARYPMPLYLLAVFLARTPRFYLISLFGGAVKIPDSLLILIFVVLIIAANAPFLRGIFKKKRKSDDT